MEAIIKAPANETVIRYKAKRRVPDKESKSVEESFTIQEDSKDSVIHVYEPIDLPSNEGYILLKKESDLSNCYWLVKYNASQAKEIESHKGYIIKPKLEETIDEVTKEVSKESVDSYRARIKNKNISDILPEDKMGTPSLRHRFA